MRSFGSVAVNWLHGLLLAGEAWWFDTSRCVQTTGEAELKTLTIPSDARDGHSYVPVRPSKARKALRALPVHDHLAYTFVDMGSGKGRMLLIAAEYPYRKIVGIEFAAELHDRAVRNLAAYRSHKQRCREIESVRMDAVDFRFPDGNLVLYFFNPFGDETMQRILQELDRSLEGNPRDVMVLTLFPDFGPLFDATKHLRLCRRIRRCDIYRSIHTVGAD